MTSDILLTRKAAPSAKCCLPGKINFDVKALKLSWDKTSSRVSHCCHARLEIRPRVNGPTPVSSVAFFFKTDFTKVLNPHHDFHRFA